MTARSVSQRYFPSTRHILPTLPPLILAVLAVAVHASCLWNGFIWDNLTLFLSNPSIRGPEGWLSIWTGKGLPDYLQLSWSAIKVCLSLFGEHPAGYHLINLMLYSSNTILLWRLLLSVKLPGAVWGAELFAVHPVGAASVGWISELKNTLSLFFAGGVVCFFLRVFQVKDALYSSVPAGPALKGVRGRPATGLGGHLVLEGNGQGNWNQAVGYLQSPHGCPKRQVKAILDTNVLISGIFFSGTPYEILAAWSDRKIELIISPEILE